MADPIAAAKSWIVSNPGHEATVHILAALASADRHEALSLAAIVLMERLMAERDRLRAILACERGESAPEGWECTIRNGEPRWIRDLAVDVPGAVVADDMLLARRQPYQSHYIWRRGSVGNWHNGGESFRYMLEAIEAADRAEKEVPRG